MKLTGESKLFLGILISTAVLIGVAAVAMTKPTPSLSRDELIPKDAHTKGNIQAKAYLVEFSDYQCPACLAAKPIVDEVTAKHKDDLLFVYRNYPLSQHPFAMRAAETAEFAGTQGKYWEMHDLLFASQEKFSDTIFADLVKELKLDEKKFAEDIGKGTYKSRIGEDQAAGDRVGVNATPTFFLNGKKLDLASFDDLVTAVDDAISKVK